MWNRIVTYAFIVFAATAPASAAHIPLVEFNFAQTDFELGPLPVAVEFRFSASGEFSTQYLDRTTQHGSADTGMSFWAPPDIVAGANLALMDRRTTYAIYNGPGNFQGPTFYQKLVTEDLATYRVTAVERVISKLVLTEVQPHVPPAQVGSWTINASQTIRYWGTLVPEAGTLMLLSIGMVHLFLSSRQRRPN